MTTGRHHTSRSKPPVIHMVHDTGGTNRLITFRTVQRDTPQEPTRSTRFLRNALLGAVLAVFVAVAALGTTTVPPDPVTPALVATVAAAPPLVLEAPVAPMVEPLVLTAAVPTVVASRKSKGRCSK